MFMEYDRTSNFLNRKPNHTGHQNSGLSWAMALLIIIVLLIMKNRACNQNLSFPSVELTRPKKQMFWIVIQSIIKTLEYARFYPFLTPSLDPLAYGQCSCVRNFCAFLTPPPRVRSIWVRNHFRQVQCIRGYSIGPSLKWQFEIRRRAGSVRFEHLSKLDRWFFLEQNSGTFSLTTCNGLPFKASLDVLRQTCQQHFGLDLPKSITPSP